MKLIGPDRYKLSFSGQKFTVLSPAGTDTFSGLATCKKPKLYIASVDERPIYVGVTRQSMRDRLRFGWTATGAGGYYGYAWRHQFGEAHLDIWSDDSAVIEESLLEMETVEAEVVFLIRCAGQWPLFQTEIHFHPSKSVHREIAAEIVARYHLSPIQQGAAEE